MKKLLTEKRKKSIIIYLILWLILAIVFVVPVAVAYKDSSNDYTASFEPTVFTEIAGNYLLDFNSRLKGFQPYYVDTVKSALMYYSFFYGAIMIVLMLKSKDTGDFHNIEHGSSDWCENGEQYKVLSRNKGIILAEHNYLPVDKHGNVNVLIVGRIWCW